MKASELKIRLTALIEDFGDQEIMVPLRDLNDGGYVGAVEITDIAPDANEPPIFYIGYKV